MKKILIGLLTLALLLVGTAFADQEDAPVLLVQLPEDAQMVENVAFDDTRPQSAATAPPII